MSLKKKIIISFCISAVLIAILASFEFFNYVAIKKEIQALELTDTIRSKSLQLRRHEKNFFLYSPAQTGEESREVHRYLDELDAVLAEASAEGRADLLPSLKYEVGVYRRSFDAIESSLGVLSSDLQRLKASRPDLAYVFPLVQITVPERPLRAAEYLTTVLGFAESHRVIVGLSRLSGDIGMLRNTGEEIIFVSKELDKRARERADAGIQLSQAAILIIFPLFLVSGAIMLFFIARNVVHRLDMLSEVVEHTGRGEFRHVAVHPDKLGNDEVGHLIRRFDRMEDQLAEREAEVRKKNRELLQSKKLAAIGTLAAGVAHELNNPLNNIYVSTQVLVRELGDQASSTVREVASDIMGQSVRVKKIVSDLLEFARGREPQIGDVELIGLIRGVFERLQPNEAGVSLGLDSDRDAVTVRADREQMERVFINLFTNAAEAMEGRGTISVSVLAAEKTVQIRVSDTGPGIPKILLEKVFEPFYTTKDSGTGLGLAIVFNIVQRHGGEITLESEEGRGATFEITLPREGIRQ